MSLYSLQHFHKSIFATNVSVVTSPSLFSCFIYSLVSILNLSEIFQQCGNYQKWKPNYEPANLKSNQFQFSSASTCENVCSLNTKHELHLVVKARALQITNVFLTINDKDFNYLNCQKRHWGKALEQEIVTDEIDLKPQNDSL